MSVKIKGADGRYYEIDGGHATLCQSYQSIPADVITDSAATLSATDLGASASYYRAETDLEASASYYRAQEMDSSASYYKASKDLGSTASYY